MDSEGEELVKPRERYNFSVFVTSIQLLLLAEEVKHRDRKPESDYPYPFTARIQTIEGGPLGPDT
jgi:hypothetical protein